MYSVFLKWLNDDDIKEWVIRLVVDKSRKKHIPSSRNYECIDFNNYIQGGYLLK